MENSNSETEISFRFTRLDKMQAITLEREVLGSLREDHVENNHYVVRVPTPLLLDGLFTLPFWPIARPLGSGVGSYHYPCSVLV